ncbi:hypothetical protein DFH29DRAFT_784482, partial [Suillus ampliporus]
GWVDEVALLSAKKRKKLARSIRSIRIALIKLRKLAFKILHSTTILLPAWKAIIADLKLAVRIMPCDVSTRWNSTYDMLTFALEYRKGLDMMTDQWRLGLGEYELTPHEWTLVKQLRDVLKVSDINQAYRIAMVLHPSHKLAYFWAAGWQQEWIDAAEELVRSEFQCSY